MSGQDDSFGSSGRTGGLGSGIGGDDSYGVSCMIIPKPRSRSDLFCRVVGVSKVAPDSDKMIHMALLAVLADLARMTRTVPLAVPADWARMTRMVPLAALVEAAA